MYYFFTQVVKRHSSNNKKRETNELIFTYFLGRQDNVEVFELLLQGK